MLACSSCGTENPEAARFCNGCGSPLAAATPATSREERRVVTVLFSDLAGFTTRSEQLDPEDVRAFLVPYYEILEDEISGHGGVVERHIGDGIMALFGAPVAHEDDPERAIRAALRILERIAGLDLDLHARIGINTGDVLFRSEGQGREDAVTGDAANTAARLQGLAPIDGVVVGETTWRATNRIFDYMEHERATVKGKTEPIRVFQPTAAKSRLGVDVTRSHETPFIGREIDFALLRGLFEKSVAANTVQLVTIVGEPGIGKSRIVTELFGHIEQVPDLITWRQGRCLPYGEGITFWALSEIVKAHAGILDSDAPDVARAKLEEVLPEGPERPWFSQRLRPLLGIEASSSAEQGELFTAWRRFFEHIAEQGPTVLIYEDLHWADDAMLAFLEHLADRAEGVPLLVVGTARPELYGRRADFAAGLPNANRINLLPLSTAETGRLVSALLETSDVPGELKQPILDRADGNPLYAEEFVRLLKDQGLLVRSGEGFRLVEGAEVPFPDSVQALIAARLDTLAPQAKAMLADAAVIGKVFWAGAVSAMGGHDPAEVAETLRDLSRKELVRPARRSSLEGEAEYAFWHILARDVAYGQLPRQARASRHVAAARWIESRSQERLEDVADVLAYHYGTALELARSGGQSSLAGELEPLAIRYLLTAGDRAFGLDTSAALSYFERVLEFTPPGHPRRGESLSRYAAAASHAGRHTDAAPAIEEAVQLLRARGDLFAAADAMITQAEILITLGDPRNVPLTDAAVELVEPLGPSRSLITAMSQQAATDAIRGISQPALDKANKVLAMAAELGLNPPARALGVRALARADLGDAGGLEDFREAIELATRSGEGRQVAILQNNYGVSLWRYEGPAASLRIFRDGIAAAKARGLTEGGAVLAGSSIDVRFESGDIDGALSTARELAPQLEAQGDVFDLIGLRCAIGRALVFRGEPPDLGVPLEWIGRAARESEDPQQMTYALAVSALVSAATGNDADAVALLEELDRTPWIRDNQNYPMMLPAVVRVALELSRPDLARRLVAGLEPRDPYILMALDGATAMLIEQDGAFEAAAIRYADVAERLARFGVIVELPFALMGQGRCLMRLSRREEAMNVLTRAREIFQRLGARPFIDQVDALLSDARAASTA
jgi:class 3 adenylate cyclase/tetratricopeptide (TPR) repeat protein